MAHYDTVWTPHTVLVTSAPSPKKHDHPHERHKHHFHFPPMALHNFSDRFKSHKAATTTSSPQGHGTMDPAPAAAWSPPADIRETKLVYHIEIEVPGVKDKKSLLIQWMSPRTLLVEGELKRPEIGQGMVAQGSTEWQQEKETPDWPKMRKVGRLVGFYPGVTSRGVGVAQMLTPVFRRRTLKMEASVTVFRLVLKMPMLEAMTCQRSCSGSARSGDGNGLSRCRSMWI